MADMLTRFRSYIERIQSGVSAVVEDASDLSDGKIRVEDGPPEPAEVPAIIMMTVLVLATTPVLGWTQSLDVAIVVALLVSPVAFAVAVIVSRRR